MEITGPHGSKVRIRPGQTRELGRTHFSDSNERTISRCHVSFFIPQSNHNLVQFEVLGVNPLYVHDKTSNEVKIFRSHEKGELRSGDMFCVSANSPVWYGLRSSGNSVSDDVRHNDFESNLGEVLESDVGCGGAIEGLQRVDCGDLDIDPVKDFGFVLMGHEFDSYPKKMIRDIKNWNWFLEEENKGSEDDDGRNVKHGQRRKRKKAMDNDDDEWTGDSEDETIIIDKPKKAQKPKYITRSKDHGKHSKDASDQSKKTLKTKDVDVDDDIEEENGEDDETLGGFIVDDEGVEEDEEVADDENEDDEEEFEDEDE